MLVWIIYTLCRHHDWSVELVRGMINEEIDCDSLNEL